MSKKSKASKSKAKKFEITGKGFKIIICALVVVFVGVLAIVLLMRNTTPEEPVVLEPDERGFIRGTVVTEDNADEIRAQFDAPPEDAYFTASMNVDWLFDTWNTPSSNAIVENDTLNTRTIYFDLFLDETDELIFSSPFIPVGASLDILKLTKEVPVGNHPATVTYYLVDDNLNEVSNVSVAVLLRILG